MLRSASFSRGALYPAVPLYFFDTRDGDDFVSDDVGLDLPDLESAKAIAARSLAELASDVLPGSDRRILVVEVRDALQPVLNASILFRAIRLVGPDRRDARP